MATYIFDFDGTIADSFPFVCHIIINHADKLRCKRLSLPDLVMLKELDSRAVLKYLGIPFWRVAAFVRTLRKITHAQVDDIPIFPGWLEALQTLRANHHQIGLISSNSQQNVEFILRKYHLIDLFDFIVCDKPLFGKTRCLQKLIQRRSLTRSSTYYIGDEVRDIEAAHSVNIQAIAVSWGFHSLSRLKLANPDYVIDDIEQISHL